ncbi:MAG: hypothetical protein ACR2QA_09235 [Solirubrobacteraceae bacterium]
MATGQGQSGGVFGWPDLPELGQESWAQTSSMHPYNPLVGGRAGSIGGQGGVNVTGNERRVAIASPASAATGGPVRGHYSELLNLKGNPIGWVLIAAIVYLGLAHISLHGSITGKAGKARGNASGGVSG